MTTATQLRVPISSSTANEAAERRPDSVILVYDGESGLGTMLLDAIKKAVGREECALCEITYSAVGKRSAWKKCESRLGVSVKEMHRDELPEAWGIARTELPCVLARTRAEDPVVLVRRDEIVSCHGSAEALERAVVGALDRMKS